MSISNSETSAGWRAETVGRNIRRRRQELGWSEGHLASVLTDHYGVRTTRMDVWRREHGLRQLTVDHLFSYALALQCDIATLLVGDDGYAWVTALRPEQVRKPRRSRRIEPARAIGLTATELRVWLVSGSLPGRWST